MKRGRKEPLPFKDMLSKYIDIKGLDIVVYLKNGSSIELNKNRDLVNDEIIMRDKRNSETRIPISHVSSIDLFAM
ncbi:MAG: hypothetical protein ACOC2H_02530 [Spirochaetota bacterium]